MSLYYHYCYTACMVHKSGLFTTSLVRVFAYHSTSEKFCKVEKFIYNSFLPVVLSENSILGLCFFLFIVGPVLLARHAAP